MKLSCREWSDQVWFVTKTRKDNDVIDCPRVVYTKNETKLSRPIRPSADYDENQIGQQRDWSYRCGLHRKQN